MGARKASSGRNRRWRILGGAAACALLAMLLQAGGAASGAAAAPGAALAGLSGPRVFGGGFTFPGAVSSDGTHVWVANSGQLPAGRGSVTELNAVTGAVKVISRSAIDFPQGICSDGTHVWVTNFPNHASNGWVTELNAATGGFVRQNLRRQLRVPQPGCRLLRRHPRVGGQQRRQLG